MTIPKALLLPIAMQTPPLLTAWVAKDFVQHRPLLSLGLLAAYELIVCFLALARKVWGTLEPEIIAFLTDWLRHQVRCMAPGLQGRYLKQVFFETRLFNVKGLRTKGTFSLPLDDVFVPVTLAPANPQALSTSPLHTPHDGATHSIWDFVRTMLLNESVPLCLLGPPGSGKTTLLQHIALTMALGKQGVFRCRRCLPVLLYLRDHVEHIVSNPETCLIGVILAHYSNAQKYPHLRMSRSWLEHQLTRNRVIVLLDGLDEVATLTDRIRVASWLDQQVKSHLNCRFIVTARPHGYTTAPLSHCNVVEVEPLSFAQVRGFLHSWYLATEIIASGGTRDAGTTQLASESADRLLTKLRSQSSLAELTVNPLLLTMIAMVHRYRGTLPERRVELYGEICDVLLGHWHEAKGVSSQFSAQQRRAILEPLAEYMMRRGKRDIATSEAVSVIRPLLARIGEHQDRCEQFLRDIEESSGICLEHEPGVWTFAHHTFQEYLCAAAWHGQPRPPKEYAKMIADAWWRETLLLHSAQADSTGLIVEGLNANTVASLSIVADCLEEAKEMSPDSRRRAHSALVAGLESRGESRRRLATEVLLERRLRAFHAMGENVQCDMTPITNAEYRLFVETGGSLAHAANPIHRMSSSIDFGPPQEWLVGVSWQDALHFCDWMSSKFRSLGKFRMPTRSECLAMPRWAPNLCFWATEEIDGTAVLCDGHSLVPASPSRKEQTEIGDESARYSSNVASHDLLGGKSSMLLDALAVTLLKSMDPGPGMRSVRNALALENDRRNQRMRAVFGHEDIGRLFIRALNLGLERHISATTAYDSWGESLLGRLRELGSRKADDAMGIGASTGDSIAWAKGATLGFRLCDYLARSTSTLLCQRRGFEMHQVHGPGSGKDLRLGLLLLSMWEAVLYHSGPRLGPPIVPAIMNLIEESPVKGKTCKEIIRASLGGVGVARPQGRVLNLVSSLLECSSGAITANDPHNTRQLFAIRQALEILDTGLAERFDLQTIPWYRRLLFSAPPNPSLGRDLIARYIRMLDLIDGRRAGELPIREAIRIVRDTSSVLA